MPVLTPDAALSLGATWSQVRQSAHERATAASFPTTDEEIWRYSRIGELDLATFTVAKRRRASLGILTP